MLDPCQQCNPQGPRLLRIRGSAGPHLGRQAPRAGGEIRRLPITTRAARSGDRLAVLQTYDPRASWMPPGVG
eukprot:1971552-Pyramimonas_sp.AAC.1